MKNLNYINCNEISEYDKIVHYKEEPGKGVLTATRPAISTDYDEYVNTFSNIVNRVTSVYVTPEKEHLQNCYGTETIERNNLIDRIIKAQSIDLQHTCGYCLYNPQSTIDHYVPQEKYPEFAVLAKNLLPACSDCNTTKNDLWRRNGKRLFLHLYNDIIPEYRFLFGLVRYYYGKPTIQFELVNRDNVIPADIFELIESHFDLLHLCDLYRKGIPKVFSDISNDLSGVRLSLDEDLSIVKVQRILIGASGKMKQKYGINYWKAIAYDILANDDDIVAQLAAGKEIY